MATRFYFQSTGTPNISPTPDAGWEQIGQVSRLPLVRKTLMAEATALTNFSGKTVPITTTQQILGFQFISDESFMPTRFQSDEWFHFITRPLESSTNCNVFVAYVLRAMSVDGSRVLATLGSSMTNSGTETTTSGSTRLIGNGTSTIGFSAASINEPWRIVLEIGGHAQAPTSSGSYTMRFGSAAATDFAFTSALTTDLNTWFQISKDLNVQALNNYRSAKYGSGMSGSERVR